MDQLRRPFLVLTLVAVGLALLVCLGSGLVSQPPAYAARVGNALGNPQIQQQLQDRGVDLGDARSQLEQAPPQDPPGLGIPYLALVDGLLLLVLVLTALPLLIGDRATGTVQGVVSIVGGVLGLIAGVTMAFAAFAALITMVTLFLAIPFGTLAYLVIFGSFDTGGAAAATSLVMFLLVAGLVLLVLAQQRFVRSVGLMLLFGTAILLTFVTALLHSIVPGILASITDAVAALITAIVGAVWALVILVGGVVAAVRLLQLGRQGGPGQLNRPAG